ncbi:MAG TPA: hypothetical protein H9902_15325 [Candidatus Stackebrandtia faecavium]|nr:hypothetical protein [Candidatus Stackebrandtia faecavium]
MRHIVSLLAGLIIAPIAWLLIGAGVTGLDPNGIYQDVAGKPNAMIALAMFAVAGILLGLLTVNRMSPAGAVATAVIFVAAFLLYRFTGFNFSLPGSLQSAKIPAQASAIAGSSGTVVVIAALMGLSLFVPSRWRGKNTDDDRVVDPASLAEGANHTQTGQADAIDPFATPQRTEQDFVPAAQDSPHRAFESVGTSQRARSPYADDGYQPDQYGSYRQTEQYQRESQAPPQFPPPDYNREPGYDPRR